MTPLQMASLFGAVLVLVGFVGQNFGYLKPSGRLYNVLNLVGSGLLFTNALVHHLWDFTVLNAVWTAVSFFALVRPKR